MYPRLIAIHFITYIWIPKPLVSQNDDVLAAAPFLQAKKDTLNWLKSNQDQMAWTALITGPVFGWASV